MIFTRIRTYLLSRKYAALCLEFFILVFGVFLSLQVNEWQNDRENRKWEQQYLRRLEKDFTNSSTSLKDTGYMRHIESAQLRESLGDTWQKYLYIARISDIRNLLRSNTFPVMTRYVKPLQGNKLTFDAQLVEQDTRELYVAMSIIRSNLINDLQDSENLLALVDRSLAIVKGEIVHN